MGKTKYKTSYGSSIEEVEITRETEKCVWILDKWFKPPREKRYLKQGNWDNFWDTWDEACQYLMQKYQSQLKNVENDLAKIVKMKERKTGKTKKD